jgi:predicted glycoside hydrolase/deacetylase ChbG (UPF0249 family)
MLKIIVNADDCGISKHVDAEIKKCIEDGIISSTTIMANMDDFDGAVKLYQDFHDKISFGIHFDLTEGHPLLYSQCLLDNGFYTENDNVVSFYGMNFNYKTITNDMKIEIGKELNAQAEKILDAGISPSHIDSHHHVHWHREILPLFCSLASKYGHGKMRREFFTTDDCSFTQKIKDNLRQAYVHLMNPNIRCVDYLVSVGSLYELIKENKYSSDKIYELMVHPGHDGLEYQQEIDILRDNNLILKLNGDSLMNYNEL